MGAQWRDLSAACTDLLRDLEPIVQLPSNPMIVRVSKTRCRRRTQRVRWMDQKPTRQSLGGNGRRGLRDPRRGRLSPECHWRSFPVRAVSRLGPALQDWSPVRSILSSTRPRTRLQHVRDGRFALRRTASARSPRRPTFRPLPRLVCRRSTSALGMAFGHPRAPQGDHRQAQCRCRGPERAPCGSVRRVGLEPPRYRLMPKRSPHI